MNVIFWDTIFESRDTLFDGQKIKEILTTIKKPKHSFEVIIKNEKSARKYGRRCSGCYNYSKSEITLYLPNFNNNNELIKTAIHEYAHHFMHSSIKHQTEFWECFFEFLEIADCKGLYSCNIDSCEKLKKITSIINEYNMIKTGKLFKKGAKGIINLLNTLCIKNNIYFEYYCVKYLKMEWFKRKDVNGALGRLFRLNRKQGEVRRDDIFQKFSSELGIIWRENNWTFINNVKYSHCYCANDEYTNFREICMGNMKNGIIYRGNYPFFRTNNEYWNEKYNEIYSENVIDAGINCIINLTGNTKDLETIANLVPWYSAFHKSNNVICLDIQDIQFESDSFEYFNYFDNVIFNYKFRQGLKFLMAHNGPYLIHSGYNGRLNITGFVATIIELLFGASIDDVIYDYLLSSGGKAFADAETFGWNYYYGKIIYDGINAIINRKINDGDNLQAHIEKYYIEKIGLTINELDIIKKKLGNDKMSTANNA
jgi:hypothetical protein